ncbi:MAG: hypothetical protein L3J87_05560, partial [Thermoplasmata archaeon]|nr:hypothetical protein [Thermoplasmata archaeon]
MRGPLPAVHVAGTRTVRSRAYRSPIALAAFGAAIVVLLAFVPTAHGAGAAPSAPSARALNAPLHNNGVSPRPLESASGAFDALDGYVLMFGGRGVSGAMDSSTWVFLRGNWSELPVGSGVAPPARYEASMAYDSEDHEVVLFGGCADSPCDRVLNDTWSFAGDRWTNLTSLERHAPIPRARAMLVDDTGVGSLLLLGGISANTAQYLGDFWSFQGGQWTQLPSPGPSGSMPSARAGSAMVFDTAQNETVVFGGGSAAGVLGDTWTYKGGNWTDVTSRLLATPGPRWMASAAYDSEQGIPLVVNGYDHGTFISDVWAFDGTSWAQLPDGSGPDASFGGLLVDDPLDGYLVYYSGVTTGFSLLTATFLYEGGSWTLLINPPGSSAFSLFGLLFPLFLLPLLFGIMFPISNRAQRRRERLLATGVNVAPGEVVRWIETPNVRSLYGGQSYVVLIFL